MRALLGLALACAPFAMAVAETLAPVFQEHDRIIAAGTAVDLCKAPIGAVEAENFRRRAEQVANDVAAQLSQMKPDYTADKVVAVIVKHQAEVDSYVRGRVAAGGCAAADVKQMIDAYGRIAGRSGGGADL